MLEKAGYNNFFFHENCQKSLRDLSIQSILINSDILQEDSPPFLQKTPLPNPTFFSPLTRYILYKPQTNTEMSRAC